MGVWAAIVLLGLTMLGAFVLVVMNRESEAVVKAAVPVALGLVSALGLVFAFTRPEPIARVFPVVFIVERASRLPADIPGRPFSPMMLGLADLVRQADPTTFEPPQQGDLFDFVLPLYHEYLQKIIVEEIATRQFGTWRVQTDRFTGFEQFQPTPDAGRYASKILSVEEIQTRFGTNRFARVHAMVGTWAVPQGTNVWIEQPERNRRVGFVGSIHLKNHFCEVAIETTQSISHLGLGKYTGLVGLDLGTAQQQFMTLQFIVRVKARFAWYLIGHPDMAPHRQWVNAIVDQLTHAFDEESLWQQTRDDYMFQQHLSAPSSTPRIQVGPIRTAPPRQ